MKRYYYIVFFLVIILAACRKDTSVDVTVMPQETTTGENTFGCIIDSWIYVGGRYRDYGTESIVFKFNGSDKMDVEVKVLGLNEPYAYIAFTIINLHDLPRCEFINARWLDRLIGNKDGEPLGSGTVKITRFDKEANIISGRFSGGKIAHGQFDVKYR